LTGLDAQAHFGVEGVEVTDVGRGVYHHALCQRSLFPDGRIGSVDPVEGLLQRIARGTVELAEFVPANSEGSVGVDVLVSNLCIKHRAEKNAKVLQEVGPIPSAVMNYLLVNE
jgi:hypothetical protein